MANRSPWPSSVHGMLSMAIGPRGFSESAMLLSTSSAASSGQRDGGHTLCNVGPMHQIGRRIEPSATRPRPTSITNSWHAPPLMRRRRFRKPLSEPWEAATFKLRMLVLTVTLLGPPAGAMFMAYDAAVTQYVARHVVLLPAFETGLPQG